MRWWREGGGGGGGDDCGDDEKEVVRWWREGGGQQSLRRCPGPILQNAQTTTSSRLFFIKIFIKFSMHKPQHHR